MNDGMNGKPENRELGRVAYWEGQMLHAEDFLDIQRIEDQKRWWHNRAMHNAYGVYQGFQAMKVFDTLNQPAIQVTPGIAYDCFGRELVLECLATISIPQKPQPQGDMRTLLVRYKKPASRKQTDPVAAVCRFCDGRISGGNIEFVWLDGPRSSPDEGVPLGAIIFSGRFIPLLTAPRRRPLSRAHLATGSTVPGGTSWQHWEFTFASQAFAVEAFVPRAAQAFEIGVQTTIDTSSAGFTEVPQYFAWLEGSIWDPQTTQLVPAVLPSLANEALDSFTFRLALYPFPPPGGPQTPVLIQNPDDFADFALRQRLYVSWVGCQMPRDVRPLRQGQADCKTKFEAGYERRIR